MQVFGPYESLIAWPNEGSMRETAFELSRATEAAVYLLTQPLSVIVAYLLTQGDMHFPIKLVLPAWFELSILVAVLVGAVTQT